MLGKDNYCIGSIIGKKLLGNQVSSRPMPAPDLGPRKTLRDKPTGGRFEILNCFACGRDVFHPRVLCSHCSSLTRCDGGVLSSHTKALFGRKEVS